MLKTVDLINELKEEYHSILKFWMKNAIDSAGWGFYGEVDINGVSVKDAPRGLVLNTRILWTFSSAYIFTQNREYLDIAYYSYKYLLKYFWDKKYGGLYWSVNRKGKVLDSRKQIYGQVFGIYAFTEYYRATQNEDSLEYAFKLFNCIELYSLDTTNGGYLEAFSREWMPLEDMRLSEKDQNEPKSMNTHLHIMEAYTNLYKLSKDFKVKVKLRELIEIFFNHILDKEKCRLQLFFDFKWNVKSSIISFGHDIECSWLLYEAALLCEEKDLVEEVAAISLQMADHVLKEGLASDNSLFNEKDSISGLYDTQRHWWVQAEAMVGFINAWQISDKTIYLEAAIKLWKYIKTYVIDHDGGEWFARIDNNGHPILTDAKIDFWKCPYHNTRALKELITRIKDKDIQL